MMRTPRERRRRLAGVGIYAVAMAILLGVYGTLMLDLLDMTSLNLRTRVEELKARIA